MVLCMLTACIQLKSRSLDTDHLHVDEQLFLPDVLLHPARRCNYVWSHTTPGPTGGEQSNAQLSECVCVCIHVNRFIYKIVCVFCVSLSLPVLWMATCEGFVIVAVMTENHKVKN